MILDIFLSMACAICTIVIVSGMVTLLGAVIQKFPNLIQNILAFILGMSLVGVLTLAFYAWFFE